MDFGSHAQLIYAHLLQAWASTHNGDITREEEQHIAENAIRAAKTYQEVAMGTTR
jgi:hypothetical protein